MNHSCRRDLCASNQRKQESRHEEEPRAGSDSFRWDACVESQRLCRRHLLADICSRAAGGTDPKPDQPDKQQCGWKPHWPNSNPFGSIESLVKQRIQPGPRFSKWKRRFKSLAERAVDLQPTGEAARRRTGGRETTNSEQDGQEER